MATTISGTSGVTTPAVSATGNVSASSMTDTGPLSVGPQGITFGDSTVQTTAGGVAPVMNVYTSPGTWTKPATVKAIKVTVIGGGGNGGPVGPSGISVVASGGGGGGTAINVYSAPAIPGPQPYTVGTATNSSSFGVAPAVVITATGGVSAGNNFAIAGAGGSASNAQLNIGGQPGNMYSTTPLNVSGSGGSTFMGGGGAPVNQTPNTNGNAGVGYGSGGSGAGKNQPGGAYSGGAGATGVVIVEEFY